MNKPFLGNKLKNNLFGKNVLLFFFVWGGLYILQ